MLGISKFREIPCVLLLHSTDQLYLYTNY